MKRFEKQNLITGLKDIFSNNSSIIVVQYKGLNVVSIENIRKETRGASVGFKVIKNSLASIALKGTPNETLADFMTGPTAIAWGSDPVSIAKLLSDMSKKYDKLSVVGGVYNGSKLSASDVKVLSSLPSFEIIRGKIVGLLTAAATKVVMVTRAPATNVIGVLNAYSKKAN